MVEVNYGSKSESPIQLQKSGDLIAVRTRSRRPLRAGPVMPAAASELADGHVVVAFPDAGVEVYRVPPPSPGRTLDQRKVALRRDPDVRFAGGVLVDPAGHPVIYTENLFIKFADSVDPEDCRQVIKDKGLSIKQEL